ncbi:MAG TPA: sulfite exporter TauE/SafE family protein [Candidatus Eisenbacteria bacterium]|nr:sulfite exporter TauE/SafE family protein [Candidatus Eisenbacteria bacterium]
MMELGAAPIQLLPAVLIGLVGGALVGLTGVGAGSVIAAGLLVAFPTLDAKLIVGSATAQAVVMKLFGVLARRRFRFGEGRLGIAMALGAIPMAMAGAWASSQIGGDLLRPIMAVVLLIVGLVLVAQAVPRGPDGFETYRQLSGRGERERVRDASEATGAGTWDATFVDDASRAEARTLDLRRLSVAIVGALVGFIAGLTSIGTGTLFVSSLVGPLRMDAHRAVAVALLAGLLTLVSSGATHLLLGHVDAVLAGGVLLGSVPGVLLGTAVSRRLSVGALRGTIGAGIAVAAVVALARLGR